MSEKITGYILLILGLGIMIFAIINVSLVFTKQIEPFTYFNSESKSAPVKTASPEANGLLSELQSGNLGNITSLQNLISTPNIESFLPMGQLNDILNLSSHFLLMFFISGFGFKLASLGIQLIRPINVKLKSTFLDVDGRGNTNAIVDDSPRPLSPLPPKLPKA